MSVEFFQQIILMLLGAALTVLTTVAIGWGTSRWGIDKMKKIEQELFNKEGLAYRAIWLAEDFAKGPGKAEERFDYAVKWATAQLTKRGMTVTEEEIHGFIRGVYAEIEDQVHEMRKEIQGL